MDPNPKTIELTDEFIARINQDFPEEYQNDVRHWRANECGTNLPFHDKADIPRIRRTILKQSQGDEYKFLSWLEVAKTDWRDVLQ